jgi:hypothetical protein
VGPGHEDDPERRPQARLAQTETAEAAGRHRRGPRQGGQSVRHAENAQLYGVEDVESVQAERGDRERQDAGRRRARRAEVRGHRRGQHQAHETAADTKHHSLKRQMQRRTGRQAGRQAGRQTVYGWTYVTESADRERERERAIGRLREAR